jgi:beta-lactamase class C
MVFATTLLAQAVRQGELSLDDPVAKYVTELQRGGDIRRITLGQPASHTSGLPRVPQQYETWHKGRYTWPDFVRFLLGHCPPALSGTGYRLVANIC